MKEQTRSTRPPLFERLKSGMEDLIAEARGEIELKTTVREMPDLDKYKVVLWWSEAEQRFLAEMPELPGCRAEGKTQQEALASVKLAALEWIETARTSGREIPQPAGVSAAA